MSVDLLPEELGFRRPFDREVTELLRITNPHKTPVAFKVKTTAPKQYCVRPNSGIVPADSHVEVQVLLQAMKEDPPLDARCRDKFLVQSMAVDKEDETNLATLWQSIEKNSKTSILERKIRVQFLPAASSTPNGASTHEDQPPAYTSPASNYGSPSPASDTKSAPTTERNKSVVTEAAEASGLAGAAAAVSNAIPTSQEELKQQLADAQAQISKLTNQLSDPQVRQRKVQEATEKVQTVVQQTNESGVPLQIVAGLCLLSFLIAYIFF